MEKVVGNNSILFERTCRLCQQVGVERAKARRKRIKHLRETLALAERFLQQPSTYQFLISAKTQAEQELTEKEVKKAEWESIRSFARWHQIDGRMCNNFFLGVQ